MQARVCQPVNGDTPSTFSVVFSYELSNKFIEDFERIIDFVEHKRCSEGLKRQVAMSYILHI